MLRREDLRALIFDFDGTLIASDIDFALMRWRVLEHLRNWGLELPGEVNQLVLETIARAEQQLAARSEGVAQYRREAEEILWEVERPACERAAPFPGVPEALRRAEQAGLRLAIITRNSRRGVQTVLSRHPLPVSVIITRDDEAQVKPHPQHVLTALQHLGVPPSQALMVGDHPTDIQGGQAAGTRTGGVLTTGRQRQEFAELGADTVAADVPALINALLDGAVP
jgi:phosphoglycolate phosphatase